jgi:hypothetical protein
MSEIGSALGVGSIWRRRCLPLAWPVLGWAVGHIAWGHAGIAQITVVLALPMLWSLASKRLEAAALMLGYFLASARGLPAGAVVFFGDSAPAWWGLAMWLSASLLLALPFMALWRPTGWGRAAGFAAALVVVAAPPIGIVGWTNPITVAGVLYPMSGWVGIGLTLGVFVVLAMGRRKAGLALTAATMALVSVVNSDPPAAAPPGWQGFDTQFAGLSSARADDAGQVLAAMDRIRWLERAIADMPRDATLVLPETVLGRFDGAGQALLDQSEQELRHKGSRVLVGAELPIEGSSRYLNAVVVLGAQQADSRAALQGIPVPISMWKPWADDGAQGDLLGRSSVIQVGAQRVAAAVCYEQLLTYSMLKLMSERPSVLVAVSNVWWARATSIPEIQDQSVRAYARLFDVPAVFARNR